MYKFFVLQFLIAFFSVNAFATDITLKVLNVRGKQALTPERALELIDQVNIIFNKELKINFVLVEFKTINNKFKRFHNLTNQRHLVSLYERFFNNRDRSRTTLKYAIVSPLRHDGLLWLAGAANGICSYKKESPVAYSSAEEKNSIGQLRYDHSIIAMAHEIGHLLGAEHDENEKPISIMHPAPLSADRNPLELHFSFYSKSQIRECVN